MISVEKRKFIVLFFALLVCLLPATSFALELSEAKKKGLVGEQVSGYLASVSDNPSDEVQKLVRKINDLRRAEYQKIAKKNGTPITAVEKIAAKKAIEMTPAGQYVRLADGSWRKK